MYTPSQVEIYYNYILITLTKETKSDTLTPQMLITWQAPTNTLQSGTLNGLSNGQRASTQL